MKLAVSRARATGDPAVFWLDANRAHDAQLIAKVEAYLPHHDTDGLDLRVLSPADATQFPERIARGENTISVTGNVCGTTSPTCSPSSRWARRPKC